MASVDKNKVQFIKTTYDKMSPYTKDGVAHEGVGKEYPNSIIQVSDADSGKKDLFIGEEKMTDNYNSNAADDWDSITVGGLQSSKASELKKKTTSELLDDILFPTYPADITDASITASTSLKNAVVEVGTTLKTKAEILAACSYETSRGSSKYGVLNKDGSWNKTDKEYAGEMIGDVSKTVTTGSFTESDGAITAVNGANKYTVKCEVTFGDGKQPVNNKGKADGTKFTQNTLSSTATVTYTGVYAIYCNGKFISNTDSTAAATAHITKPTVVGEDDSVNKKIIDSNTVSIAFAPQAGNNETFKIYLKGKTVSSITTLSDITNKWSSAENRGTFTKTGTNTIGSVTYDVWELKNLSTGNAKIQFTLK